MLHSGGNAVVGMDLGSPDPVEGSIVAVVVVAVVVVVVAVLHSGIVGIVGW